MSAFDKITIQKLKPLKDYVIVSNMNFGERKTSGGIVVKGDDLKMEGVRPRWAQVYAVGDEQKDIKVGDWILVAHGRWTRGVKIEDNGIEFIIRRVDNKDIIAVSDEEPADDTIGA